jgi:hypothetical protein
VRWATMMWNGENYLAKAMKSGHARIPENGPDPIAKGRIKSEHHQVAFERHV